jgi:hypothetical protein
MRKVIVSNNVTLDGRVDEVRDWALPYDDDESVKYHTDLLSHSDGLLFGRKTYEFFAALSHRDQESSPTSTGSTAWRSTSRQPRSRIWSGRTPI